MKKNVASQVVGAQLNSATDGSAVTTGTTTVYVTGDGGTQASGGTATHEGNGFWTFLPSQANTNYDHVAFTFVNSSAITVTVQCYTTFPQTGDSYARLGAPAGASVSADVAAVKSDTSAILVDTNELQGDWTNAGRLDTILDTIAADVVNIDGAAMRGTDSAATAAALATAQADLDILTGADGVTLATLQPNYAPNTTTPPTAAAIADQVWDEALSGHLGTGSTGEALNAAGSAGDPWTTALPGAYGAGSAGYIVGTNLNAAVANVEADTQNIQSRLPAALVGGRIDANAGAISADATAADNLEAMLDGTGGVKLSLSQLNVVASGNDSAIVATGAGTGHGFAPTGGATGHGVYSRGGATSGDGWRSSAQLSGSGLYLEAAGTTKNGVHITGGASAAAIYLNGANGFNIEGTSHAIKVLGGALFGAGDALNLTVNGSGAAINAGAKNEIADAVLNRGAANTESTAGAASLTELLLAAFESAVSGSTWTIYKTDRATTFSTRTVTTDANADPITEVT